jgi:hypothetical protein
MPGPLPMLPQALALLTVRLLAQQLRYTPALLGPRTPGALVGVLGRFLACGSAELQVCHGVCGHRAIRRMPEHLAMPVVTVEAARPSCSAAAIASSSQEGRRRLWCPLPVNCAGARGPAVLSGAPL